jgi:hypothetical protein
MTFEKNIEIEFKMYSEQDGYKILETYQDLHGKKEGLKAFLEQIAWNIKQRALVNGQEAVEKEL